MPEAVLALVPVGDFTVKAVCGTQAATAAMAVRPGAQVEVEIAF